jgi:amidohydrolase
MDALKTAALAQIEGARDALLDLSCQIQAHPELGYQEFQAAGWLTDFLAERGFAVQRGVADMPTAFIATLQGAGPGPTLAIVAEYDALPGVGHGCGHNLIAAAAAGAAAGLAPLMPQLPGALLVIGAPAEEFTEGKAGKIRLLEEGAFAGVDACLMFHPWTSTRLARSNLAFVSLDVTFHGRPAHAAADPWNGCNALDGVVLTYVGLSALRQQLKPDARLHCIITRGGDAANIIPEVAAARIMLRSPDDAYVAQMLGKVEGIIRGAASASGTTVDIQQVTQCQTLRFFPTFYDVVKGNAGVLGCEMPLHELAGGSTDFGNVSHALPGLHIYVKTHEPGTPWHSQAVAETAAGEPAHAGMLTAARIMALSLIDLFTGPEVLAQIKEEFAAPA